MEMKELKEKLEYTRKNAWDEATYDETELQTLAEEYRQFISEHKTEREWVKAITTKAKEAGFSDQPGDKFFLADKHKTIALVRLGSKPLSDGVKIVMAHIDCPRLDLKQNPLYEDTELAFLKTHYYGGIKKYQWVTRPLALHGVIILQSGEKIEINIGENDNDPVFFINDLLPHLSHKVQEDKKIKDAIIGEKLNVLIGSRPIETDEDIKDKVKLQILNFLHETYGLVEEDFLTAEIEVVPAGVARYAGFDRSLICGYGQDDRIASYTALKAILEANASEQTGVVILVDKEEIGSAGNTSAKSMFLKQIIKAIFQAKNEPVNALDIDTCLFHSMALSADVNAALDPDWKEVYEERNAAKLGYGVCLEKYTGSRGKYSASDANAEFYSAIRRFFNQEKIVWQIASLGKVDEGGGGTIAKYLAHYGMEVVDIGPPVLSMHAPMEMTSKIDLLMTYRSFKAFLERFSFIAE